MRMEWEKAGGVRGEGIEPSRTDSKSVSLPAQSSSEQSACAEGDPTACPGFAAEKSSTLDDDLRRVVDAWPQLPANIKAAVVALVTVPQQ